MQYTFAVTVYRFLRYRAPRYLADCCVPVSEVSGRQHLSVRKLSQTEYSAVSPQHIWQPSFSSRRSNGLELTAYYYLLAYITMNSCKLCSPKILILGKDNTLALPLTSSLLLEYLPRTRKLPMTWVSVPGGPKLQGIEQTCSPTYSDLFPGWKVANEIAKPQVSTNSNSFINLLQKKSATRYGNLQSEIKSNEYSSSKKLLE